MYSYSSSIFLLSLFIDTYVFPNLYDFVFCGTQKKILFKAVHFLGKLTLGHTKPQILFILFHTAYNLPWVNNLYCVFIR